MTVGEFRRDCAKSIGTFAPEEAHVLCDILLANVLGCDRSALLLSLSREMETEDARRMAEAVADCRSVCRCSISSVRAGSIIVRSRLAAAVIPRGDTEFLAAAAVAALPEGGELCRPVQRQRVHRCRCRADAQAE